MSYEHFYQFYDQLMDDVKYDNYLLLVKKYANITDSILDVGCGTGNILIPLLEAGYYVDGLDLSDEMLSVTKGKCEFKNLKTNLYQDDMKAISIQNEYNIIVSFLDTINYLKTKTEVKKTFLNIYQALKANGIFIFDIHSLNKVHNVFDGYSYNDTNEYCTYLWNTFVERNEDFTSLYQELSFFIKKKQNLYQRFDEFHEQVIYPLHEYRKILEGIGFIIEEISFDFDKSKNEHNCDKIIIVAKKYKL